MRRRRTLLDWGVGYGWVSRWGEAFELEEDGAYTAWKGCGAERMYSRIVLFVKEGDGEGRPEAMEPRR